jgi:hypothetical protein
VISGESLAPGCGLEQGFESYLFKPAPRKSHVLLMETPAEETTRQALETVAGLPRDRPFFLWVHYFDPHHPYAPPDRFLHRNADPYDGEVAYVDEQIGRLMDGLDGEGRLKNTLIAVTSDHGEGLGEHGEATHAFFLFDSTLKVPLIVKGPGIPGGRRCLRQVRSVDLHDALLSLADPACTDLSDLADYLRNPEAIPGEHPAFSETLYCYRNFRWAQMTSFRTEDRKLIRGSRDDFYDRRADPGECAPLGEAAGDETWAALARGMTRSKESAHGGLAPGPVFRLDLPGYFGGSAGNASARGIGEPSFLPESENRKLPHPPDRADRVNLLLEAIAAGESGEVNRAYLQLKELSGLEPRNPTVLFWLARVSHKIAEREGDAQGIRRAGELFQAVLELSPGEAQAFHMRVWCLLQLGEFEEAKKRLDEAGPGLAERAKTWELKGYLYSAEVSNGAVNPYFNFAEAVAAFDRSLALNKNNSKLLQQLIAICKKQSDAVLEDKYARMLRTLESEGWR